MTDTPPPQVQLFIEFPLWLNCVHEGFTISDDLRVWRMDEASRERLLGIHDAEFYDNPLCQDTCRL